MSCNRPPRLAVGLILGLVLALTLTLAATGLAQAADPLSWTPATLVDTGPNPDNSILDVSCPVAGLCVATDEDGNILTSTDPTGGEEADWSAPVSLDPGRPLIRSRVRLRPSVSLSMATAMRSRRPNRLLALPPGTRRS